MTGIEVLLAVAGIIVTVMVVAGMILLTPLGEEQVHTEGSDPHGSNLSPLPAPDRPEPAPATP